MEKYALTAEDITNLPVHTSDGQLIGQTRLFHVERTEAGLVLVNPDNPVERIPVTEGRTLLLVKRWEEAYDVAREQRIREGRYRD